jgi:hypothetical protein
MLLEGEVSTVHALIELQVATRPPPAIVDQRLTV